MSNLFFTVLAFVFIFLYIKCKVLHLYITQSKASSRVNKNNANSLHMSTAKLISTNIIANCIKYKKLYLLNHSN